MAAALLAMSALGCSSDHYLPPAASVPDGEVAILKSRDATYIAKIDGLSVKGGWEDMLPTSAYAGGSAVRVYPGQHDLEIRSAYGTSGATARIILELLKGTTYSIEKAGMGSKLKIKNVTANREWTFDFHTLAAIDPSGKPHPIEKAISP
jgi:hypothetical protein